MASVTSAASDKTNGIVGKPASKDAEMPKTAEQPDVEEDEGAGEEEEEDEEDEYDDEVCVRALHGCLGCVVMSLPG